MFTSKDRHELAELREQRGVLYDSMRASLTLADAPWRASSGAAL